MISLTTSECLIWGSSKFVSEIHAFDAFRNLPAKSKQRGSIFGSSLQHKSFATHPSSSAVVSRDFDYIRRRYSSLSAMLERLPLYVSGEIVRGFQRGSAELGIPTANFTKELVQSLPEEFRIGIYYGWANVNNGDVYKMVLSVGWNPFYVNIEKSMETHVIHKYDRTMYGETLKICILGYLRPEKNFKSVEDLIEAIHTDISDAELLLEQEENNKYQYSKFFSDNVARGIYLSYPEPVTNETDESEPR